MSGNAAIVHSPDCVIFSDHTRCTCGADLDMSPFETPTFETVEPGIPGPWNDKTWEADNRG